MTATRPPETDVPRSSTRRARATILIADDDAESRSLAAAVLQRVAYHVLEVDNGDDAIDGARLQLPRLVILEVNLPALSGYEVCHQLKEEFRSLPIILVSGERTEPFDRVAGMLIGADDYLVKPFAPDELLARLHALIRRARERRRPTLTRVERDLVRLLRQGVGAGEVAERLGEAEPAVRERVDRVLTKLGV